MQSCIFTAVCAARSIPLVVREKLVKELDSLGVTVGSLEMSQQQDEKTSD